MLSRDLQISSMGSLFLGGALVGVKGQPVQELRYAADAPALRIDPNGTYVSGQIYVQYTTLARPKYTAPIIFISGGTFTGAMWEDTPDGRPGWNSYFLRQGYSTFVTDGVGRGRASWARFPDILKAEPTFRPNEETWTLLRIGTRYTPDPGGREAFPGGQFPVEHFDDFAKQTVPRFAGQHGLELEAYNELVLKIGACIIVGQSSGAYLATKLAVEFPDLVKAIVAVEMTAVPDLDANKSGLVRVPQLLLWGDNWQNSSIWAPLRASNEAYAAALSTAGGNAQLYDLPEHGIFGNTHQMMMDRNNDVIADVVADWLARTCGDLCV